MREAVILLAAISCVALSFAVYWPVLDDYFARDDFSYLREVREHSFIEVVVRAFSFPDGRRYWRPLTFLYFLFARPAGFDTQPFHVVSVALHGIVGALGVLFVARFTRSLAGGVITGLLFTVAPTYDFVVIWISDVSELLAAAFLLSALISYHAYLTAARERPLYAFATAAFAVLGLASKESTAILVVLLPALALAVPQQERRRTRAEVLRTLVWPVLLGAVFTIVMQVRERLDPGGIYKGTGWQSIDNFWRFLTWIVFPYRFGEAMGAREAGAALLLASGVGTMLLRRWTHAFLFVWILIAIVPFTGFGAFLELRHTYLPTLPFLAFLACGAVAAVKARPRPAALPLAALLALGAVAALIVTPMRTRDQQAFFSGEATNYKVMVESVRSLCGDMPPDSSVFVVAPPYRDLPGGLHTDAALDLYYDRVRGGASSQLPPLAAVIENKCVIQYVPGTRTYVRVE